VIQALLDYYRIPVDSLSGLSATNICAPGDVGFFQFGPRNICYGRCHSGTTPSVADSGKFDASKEIRREGTTILIPFDFTEVIENLRLERYRQKMTQGLEMFAASEPVRKLYYLAREVLPVSVRRQLQKAYFRDWRQRRFRLGP